MGRPFEIVTYHSAMRALMTKVELSDSMQLFKENLSKYNYDIV